MNKDAPQIDQPDGTYRDAINAVVDSKLGAICSDLGNELTSEIKWSFISRTQYDLNFTVIGHIALPADAFIVFGVAKLENYAYKNGTKGDIEFSGIFYVSDRDIIVDNGGAILGVGNQWVIHDTSFSANAALPMLDSKIIPLFISPNKNFTYGKAPLSSEIHFENSKPLLGYLNFDKYHPISGEFKILSNGNVMVYFTDNKYTKVNFEDYLSGTTTTGTPTSEYDYIVDYNPPRAFNLTRQLKCLASEFAGEIFLYPNDVNNSGIHIDRLNIFTDSGRIPIIELDGVNLGGGLKTGAYYLGLAYSDEDGFETNVLTLAPPVYIVPTPDDSFPIESIGGAPANTQTNKSIRWEIKNSNIEYKYLIPYVIQYIGNELKAIKLEVVDTYSPLGNPIYVTYTGIERVATEAVDKVILDKVRYLSSKVMAQLDNKLYLANMTARKDLGYQRFANSIIVEPVTREMPNFDPRYFDIYNINEGYSQLIFPDNDTTDPTIYTMGDNLDGDGVIAMSSLNFIAANYNDWHDGTDYRDGTAPYEYLATRLGRVDAKYLQGLTAVQSKGYRGYRDPFLNFAYKSFRRQEVYAFYISFILKDGSESYAYHIPGQNVDDYYKNWTDFRANILTFNPGEIVVSRPNSRPYQYVDTSELSTLTDMGHWENESEFYPDTNDFDIWNVLSNGAAIQLPGSSIRGLNVRHHKMPGNKGDYSTIKLNEDFSSPNIDLDAVGSKEERAFAETVRILGIKLSNLKIPKIILEQIQGYKIYFAKRTQVNKTILGQSLVHPANLYLAANFSATLEVGKDGPYFNIWAFEGKHITGGVHTKSAWFDYAYMGQPVMKFHDFNLLRNKHSLTGATHVDLQYIVTMQHWRGGYKNAIPSELTSQYAADPYFKGTLFYKMFRDGYGESEYSWIHADLANLTNANYSLTELNADGIPTYEEFYNVPGVRFPWGQVFVGAAYWTPGTATNNGVRIDVGTKFTQYIVGAYPYPLGDINTPTTAYQNALNSSNISGSGVGIGIGPAIQYYNGVPWSDTVSPYQNTILNKYQTVFMLEPNASSYINGISLLKPTDATAYKGASYLSNLYGETGIALGLVSGPPVLGGYRDTRWTFENIVLDAAKVIATQGLSALFGGSTPRIWGELDNTYRCDNCVNDDEFNIATDVGRNIAFSGYWYGGGGAYVQDYFEIVTTDGYGAGGSWTFKYVGPVTLNFTVKVEYKYGHHVCSYQDSCADTGGCYENREDGPFQFYVSKKPEGGSFTVAYTENRTFWVQPSVCGKWPGEIMSGYDDHTDIYSGPISLAPGDTLGMSIRRSDGGGIAAERLYHGRCKIDIYPSVPINPGSNTTNNGYWLETFLLDEKLKPGLKNLVLRTVTKDHHVLRQETADKGRPNVYLTNLCAEKSDVFEPFDQQKLVWTGFYRDLSDADPATGNAPIHTYNDIEKGDGKRNRDKVKAVSSSGDVFVPDTVCPGTWSTFYTGFQSYADPTNVYLAVDNSGTELNFRNQNVVPGGKSSIEIQIPAGTPPGVYPVSFYKAGSKIRDTQYITVEDCTGPTSPVPPRVNLYTVGDTVDVFGGDTYICKYSYRTTSFDYPLNRFIKGPNALYKELTGTADDYIFGDIPLNIATGMSGEYPVMKLQSGGSSLSLEEKRKAIIQDERNWTWGNYDLFSTVYQILVESDDNLNYRHSGDVVKGVSESSSLFFDKALASDVVFKTPLKDLTKQDNLLYENHYSAVQDIRATIPFPKRGRTVSLFPNRIVRSNLQTGSFVDAYRTFLGYEFKDIALNRGPINNIFVLESLLYIHTEKSLFKTQGKQTVELSDTSEAYVGSGDIFIRDVVELLYQSNDGYLGLYDKTGSILTKDGYVFLSYNARKLFLIGGKEEVKDLTLAGMSRWFIDNIPFKYDKYYGMNSILLANAPNAGFGFTLGYDPIYKRVFLTKLDLETSLPITNNI
jgi:hypothetical protein